MISNRTILLISAATFFTTGTFSIFAQDATPATNQTHEAMIKGKSGVIRTPSAPPTPRINGAGIFGVRPDHPFFYHIPATGDRPMEFSADKLPEGLILDARSGMITGTLSKPGDYLVTFHAKNALGVSSKKFKIVVGENIALTPTMGWNSWNHYAGRITQDIVLDNAKAMVDSGLINHGWSYINIDDTWQGPRARLSMTSPPTQASSALWFANASTYTLKRPRPLKV